MRHKSLVIIGCATLALVVSTIEVQAQRRHRHHRVAVIQASPLFFGSGFYDPYYLGYGQWYPYPVFGYPPPGFYRGNHEVAVRLQVMPREAVVYVDGYAAGIVDDYDGVFQRLRLMPGHHEIVIYHQGLRTLRQNLYFNPGSTHTIRHTLDPLAPGEAAEPQPVPRAMPPGPGMPPPQGAPAADPSRMGSLTLRVQPIDATVLIDGEPWKGPKGQERLVIQLSEGPHRVEVEKPGFQSFAVDVDVRAGETASFNVSLR